MLDSKIKAPEFTPGLPWINVSEPLTFDVLRGKIVLLDFWTFCCADCMHILPYLKMLEKKYEQYLIVIGVHTAKFDNEGSAQNIKQAVLRYGIEHPVVCDRGYSLWEKFFIREWPTLVLIDPDGNIVERIPCSKKPQGKFEEPIEHLINEFENRGMLSDRTISQIKVQADVEASSTLRFPGKVLIDNDEKRLFISDSGHNRIVICNLDGEIIDTIGSGSAGARDGNFDEATLRSPQGLCLWNGMLLIADTDNHLIRAANLKERTLETIAGNGKQWLQERESTLLGEEPVWHSLSVPLCSPWDLATKDDRLFIAMAGSHQIWCMNLSERGEQKIQAFAGTGRESLVDGDRNFSQLSQPSGLCLLGERLYFVDSETSSLRFVDLQTNLVTTLVGEGLFAFGDVDGRGKEIKLQHPLAIETLGEKLLIGDSYNHKIKEFDPVTNTMRSLSGSGKAGKALGNSGEYSEPSGLSVDYAKADPVACIADTNNHRIVQLNLNSGISVELPVKAASGEAHTPAVLPNLHFVELDPMQLSITNTIDVSLDLIISDNYHLNEELPVSIYILEGKGISFPRNSVQKTDSDQRAQSKLELRPQTIEKSRESKFVFRMLTANEPGQYFQKIAIVAYFCAEGAESACFVKSFVFELQCTLTSTESNEQKTGSITLPVVLP